jgi:glycosyltransferase involved in cell wall biosynthesis
MRRAVIAIDASRSSTDTKTGTEWYSAEVIRALAEIHDRPNLALYYHPRRRQPVDATNLSQRPVRMPRLWTHIGLSTAMLRDRPDALFVPSHVIPAYHPQVSVVTLHDLGFIVEPDSHPQNQRRLLDITSRWNARVARRIIAVSAQTRADLLRYYRVAPEKVVTVHSGVDHTRFFQQRVDWDTLRRIGIDRPYILFLSTVQPRKNVIRLIEAFEMLDRPNLLLVVAGKAGWLSETIMGRIEQSSARRRILRLGHVADHQVPALYNGAQAFVLPSLYEGFGMGILEAMACGCPVVASNRSSLPEIAGDAALLVDPLDPAAMCDAISRTFVSDQRSALITAGLRRAREFTWQKTARETLTVIEDAMHGRG